MGRFRGGNPDRDIVPIEANNAECKMETSFTSGLAINYNLKHADLFKWDRYLNC